MVDFKCLSCGKIIEMPQYINAQKYDGHLICRGCGSLLHIKLVGGAVEKYKVVEKNWAPIDVKDLTDEELLEIAQGKSRRKVFKKKVSGI
ncbi:MAG: hypothetical protein PVJ61_00715 [Dehalococcoidia bacterium]|jgi:hypothetical protein